MFSNIQHGWATFKLGKFTGQCSYLTDPILDIADVLCNKTGVIEIDEEGSFFEIIITQFYVYIVSHREKDKLYMTDLTADEFAKLFVQNAKENMQAWIDWDGYTEYDNIPELQKSRRNQINSKLRKIKQIYKL